MKAKRVGPLYSSLGSLAYLAVLFVGSGCGETEAQKQAKAGAALFATRCAVCHATGSASTQGPGLGGVVGRKAASATFAYSQAMRASNLTWDAATLDRFLAAPSQVVAGTTMPIATPDGTERRALIAYLATLHASPGASGSNAAASGAKGTASGEYHADAPGARHHVGVADLPKPFATPSVQNSPGVVDRPPNATPLVPAGFQITLFADGLREPRAIRVAPNGDAFLSESSSGQIRVLRAKDGATRAEQVEVYATGLERPFGMAFFPLGPSPKWLYVANTNSVVRFPYTPGDLNAKAPPETVVAKLIDSSGGHWTRDVAFSPDGARMFVSVGSGSNVAESMPKTPPQPIAAWESSHGLGASWGDEEHRADVLSFTPDGKDEQVFANGIRNCVGLAVQPKTGDLWCSTNERDGLGDDLVPDYVTRVRQGAFYGWPWIYLGDHVDPRHDGERPDLLGKVTMPDVLLQAHSASLEMTFYEGATFPAEMRGSAFSALHGSWNRGVRTGPKVVRYLMRDGVPTGDYEDFVTGFVVDDGHVWGRPVGVAVAHDGALLVSEDASSTVWRIAPK